MGAEGRHLLLDLFLPLRSGEIRGVIGNRKNIPCRTRSRPRRQLVHVRRKWSSDAPKMTAANRRLLTVNHFLNQSLPIRGCLGLYWAL